MRVGQLQTPTSTLKESTLDLLLLHICSESSWLFGQQKAYCHVLA